MTDIVKSRLVRNVSQKTVLNVTALTALPAIVASVAGAQMRSATDRMRPLPLAPGARAGFYAFTLRSLCTWLFFLCAIILFPFSALAQNPAPNVEYTSKAVDLGLRGNLTVNPSTRAVEIQITLGSYAGRAGLDVPIAISYSSKVHRIKYEGFNPGHFTSSGQPIGDGYTLVSDRFAEYSNAGWTTSVGFPGRDFSAQGERYDQFGSGVGTDGQCPGYPCLTVDRILFRMPDGSTHELRSSDQPRFPDDPIIDNYYSVDGARMRYQSSTQTLFMADGSRYILDANPKYIDRNGNTITNTDTLGRPIPNPPMAGASGDYSYSLPGVGGSSINYTFKWRYLDDPGVLTSPQPLQYVADSSCPFGTGSYSPHLFLGDSGTRTCIVNGGSLFKPAVLYQIILPTGQAYTFTYNIFGEIDKVVLPTGGYERYEYAHIAPLSNMVALYSQANRGVVNHWISASGTGTDEGPPWHYSGGGGSVSITAPDGSASGLFMYTDLSLLGTFGYSLNQARAGRIFDASYDSAPDGTGVTHLLRRHLTEWSVTGSNATSLFPSAQQYATRNSRVTKEVEIVLDTGTSNALAKTTVYNYDLSYQFSVGPIETSVNEYDWVAIDQSTAQTGAIGSIPLGNLLRTQETTNFILDPNISQSVRDAYRARNLGSLPTSTRIKNALGTIVAQGSISYDEYSLTPIGTIASWTDPQTPYRGNATTMSRWLDTTGAYLQTHAYYDQFGNVRTAVDAKGNQSQIDYSSTYQYAYPTTATTAVPDPSGQYASTSPFSITTNYDFNTGKVVSTTDANAKTTSYDYTDPLNRLTLVTQPNGAHVSYIYSDTPNNLYVRVLADEDASRVIETRKYFDNLGRAVRGFLYDGTASTPWLVTDTYYDTLGRVAKVSNPYRVSSPSAAAPASCSVCTTTGYDALSRVLTITTADSAQVVTSYGGATTGTLGMITTVTDQAGRKRRSLTDALGRLVRVDEPNKDTGNLDVGGASTSYTYDVLSNLRKVDQGGQQRYFMYDSLSRLIRAKNPEQAAGSSASNLTEPITGNNQWSMAYGYDNNGNLTARVDARNVTTTYAYDALNRDFSVTCSDGTPTVYRYYDSATNGRGRLYWDQAVGVSANVFDAYDAMGRPTQYHQRFWVNGAWGQYFNVARTYDKAGHVLTQTYPSGHIASYGYDIAGRINSDTGNLGDGVTRTYATALTYSQFGGIQQEQFGTQTSLFHKLHYNLRGQLYDVRLSTYSLQANEWDWNRGAVVNYFSGNYSWGGNSSGSGTDNNGNLTRQSSYVPANESLTSYNFSEDTFSYDYLNRLKSVREVPGTVSGYGVPAFTQAYEYDVFGNRTINQSLTSASVPHPNYTADTGTNRLIAPAGYTYSYDPAGNQTSDNYTGQGARTYDAENRLRQAQGSPNNQWQTYTYDADGRRIKRNVNNAETWQVYGLDGELLAEYQSGAAAYLPATEYGYRSGELLTTISSGDSQRLSRFVTNLYYGALQRDPTAAELQDKINQLAAAGVVSQSQLLTTASQIARSLFTSTNYETSPYRSDVQYVTDLYYAYLQRGPDDSGLNFWTGQAAGSRVNVCNAFEASSEFQTLVATLYGTAASDNERTEHFVNDFYLGAYGRNATATELQQQSDALNTAAAQGQSQVQTQAESFGRSLFAAQVNDASLSNTQYVTNLYEAFLQRGPDAGGLSFWSGQASVGTGRQNVLNAFATCSAFRELSGTLYREVNWLVTDHLGTPRMVLNRSGSLASVKRHDYLPFGEELSAGIGGRTTTQGYTGDSVRQKFTRKERDNETGLDYFGTRYFASTQGRFTSSDPLLSSGNVYAPQTWNRYSYTINNPLNYTDPFGMYICNGTKDQCKDVEKGLNNLKKARDSFKKGSDQYNRLDRSLNAYGAKGVDNGVTVAFGTNKDGSPAATVIGIRDNNGDGMKDVTAANPTGQDTVVTIDTSQQGSAADYATGLGHEGSHVADGAELVGALPVNLNDAAAAAVQAGPLNLTKYQTETRAYGVSAAVTQGLGYDSLKVGPKDGTQYEIWNSGWKQADRATKQAAGIDKVLAEPKSKKGLYEVTPTNQGKRLIE